MIKKEQLNKINTLQKKAISLINLQSNAITIMKEEKILSIAEIIKLELIKIGHHLTLGTLPVNLSETLKKDHLSDSLMKKHNYDTRHKRDLYLPKAKVKSYRDSFLYKSILEYNSLPKNLKSIQKMPAFAKLCKKELFNK